jgi:hypothetical protein
MKKTIFAIALVAFMLCITLTAANAQERFRHAGPNSGVVVHRGGYANQGGYYSRGFGYSNGWYPYGYAPRVTSLIIYDSVYEANCNCYVNEPFIATWDGGYGGYRYNVHGSMRLRRR